MGKSGRENITSQDTIRNVSENLTPFNTPDIKYRTSRVHFKTFDDWVKARKTKCDMVLRDVSNFVSEKMGADHPSATDAPMTSCPSHRQPNSRQQRGMVTPRCPDHLPSTEERPPWETTTVEESPPWNIEESSPWNKIECSPSYRDKRQQAPAREGKIQSQIVMAAPPFKNVSSRKRPKSPKVTEMTHFKTLS